LLAPHEFTAGFVTPLSAIVPVVLAAILAQYGRKT
jgi:hypothetical protein